MLVDDPQPDPSNLNISLYNVVSRISFLFQCQQQPTLATAIDDDQNRDRQSPFIFKRKLHV